MKKNNELISVIIPVYKVKKYLDKCVNSVINQTYKELEIILVDDGSPDECGKMCDEYALKDERIVVIHKENGGLSDARNKGLDVAKGKYVSFIDSDDYVENDYIEFLYKLISKSGCKMSICSHTIMYENGKNIDLSTNEEKILKSEEVLERILYHDGIDLSAWAKLYDIELFENVRFPVGRLFEDAATTYKLICQCDKIGCGQISKYNYIIRNNSITTCEFNIKKMDLIKSTNEMCDYILTIYPKLEKATIRRRVYANCSTLVQLAKSNKKFPNEQKKLISYVRANSLSVFFNRKAPNRDRFAILSLMFGFKCFKKIWNIYEKIRRV